VFAKGHPAADGIETAMQATTGTAMTVTSAQGLIGESDTDCGASDGDRGGGASLDRRNETGNWAKPFIRKQMRKAGPARQAKIAKIAKPVTDCKNICRMDRNSSG
jgi:hypothetical protein